MVAYKRQACATRFALLHERVRRSQNKKCEEKLKPIDAPVREPAAAAASNDCTTIAYNFRTPLLSHPKSWSAAALMKRWMDGFLSPFLSASSSSSVIVSAQKLRRTRPLRAMTILASGRANSLSRVCRGGGGASRLAAP